MTNRKKDWEIYERMIARLMTFELGGDLCVTPNAHAVGRISNRPRQIDVLIDARHDTDNSRRVIVDAKKRKRKIDVTQVEAFLGLMKDVGATHGYLVCPAGHTKAAEARAQLAVSICLVPLNQIPDFDPSRWPECHNPSCRHARVFWDGFPAIDITLAKANELASSIGWVLTYVHYVGKCDRCGRFHVLCLTCGDMFSLLEDDEENFGNRCRCKPPWFWIASVEADERGELSAELHSVMASGAVTTVDRRPYAGSVKSDI